MRVLFFTCNLRKFVCQETHLEHTAVIDEGHSVCNAFARREIGVFLERNQVGLCQLGSGMR